MNGAGLRTLLLFDIDGTLVQKASGEHAAAMREAMFEVHGLDPGFREPAGMSAAGRTDGEIARINLRAGGIAEEAIDAGAIAVREATVAAYERLCPQDLSALVAPGIAELLPRLAARDDVVLALVTGNFEPVARLKLARAGIGSWFEGCPGGFGSDREDRLALPAIARRRAGVPDGVNDDAWPRAATIVIGDTPRDIACARADGVRVVAVTTGPYAADELREADAVAGPGELDAVLERLL